MSDMAALMAQIRPFHQFAPLLYIDDIAPPNKLVPLVPNSVQKRLINEIIVAGREGRPARLIILKARQMGMSTILQSWMFHKAIINQGFKARTVAQLDASASSIFKMTEAFYRNLPTWMTDLEPWQRRGHTTGKKLELNNNSILQVETANTKTAGRGASAQMLHLSEVAHWPVDAEYAALSLMQMVQGNPGTLIALESTPNGAGGYYWEEWIRAKEGSSDFVPIFEPWFIYEPYVIPTTDKDFDGNRNFRYQDDAEEEEAHHPAIIQIQGHPLTPEQVLWRRNKIASGTGGNVDKFNQEFPRDDVSAFLMSGRSFFTAPLINKFHPVLPAKLMAVQGKKLITDKTDRAPLHVWHEPEKGIKYVVSVDAAGVQGSHGDGEDWSVICVMRTWDKQTCAVWRDRVDPDKTALAAYGIAKWYNNALLAPEITGGAGSVVLYKLKDDLKYRNFYLRTRLETRFEPETEMQGWNMQADNRDNILAELFLLLRDAPERLCDDRLKTEMTTFVVDKNGKAVAKSGSHDDLIIAFAIALQVSKEHRQGNIDVDGKPKKRKPQQYQGRVIEGATRPDGSGTLSPGFHRRNPK